MIGTISRPTASPAMPAANGGVLMKPGKELSDLGAEEGDGEEPEGDGGDPREHLEDRLQDRRTCGRRVLAQVDRRAQADRDREQHAPQRHREGARRRRGAPRSWDRPAAAPNPASRGSPRRRRPEETECGGEQRDDDPDRRDHRDHRAGSEEDEDRPAHPNAGSRPPGAGRDRVPSRRPGGLYRAPRFHRFCSESASVLAGGLGAAALRRSGPRAWSAARSADRRSAG